MPKIRPIIFEGVDGSGKDYLRQAFAWATKHRYLVITRLFISAVVYSKLYGRKQEAIDNLILGTKFMYNFKPLVVYCSAIDSVLSKRIIARGECAPDLAQTRRAESLFRQTIEEMVPENYRVFVDTSNDPDYKNGKVFTKILAALRKLDKEERHGR